MIIICQIAICNLVCSSLLGRWSENSLKTVWWCAVLPHWICCSLCLCLFILCLNLICRTFRSFYFFAIRWDLCVDVRDKKPAGFDCELLISPVELGVKDELGPLTSDRYQFPHCTPWVILLRYLLWGKRMQYSTNTDNDSFCSSVFFWVPLTKHKIWNCVLLTQN